VLIYWFTTNVWTMGQQFWVIRRNPVPGSPAYAAWEKRKQEQRARGGLLGGLIGGSKATANGTVVDGAADGAATETAKAPPTKRVQPQRLPRSKRKGR
jgi:YidC/Oxa1 family membrane protein insertase